MLVIIHVILRCAAAARQLILAEKASVMDAIALTVGGLTKVKGKCTYWKSEGLFVASARGHLVEIDLPKKCQRSMPIIPDAFEMFPVAGCEGRLELIASLAAKSQVLVNACDAGRIT